MQQPVVRLHRRRPRAAQGVPEPGQVDGHDPAGLRQGGRDRGPVERGAAEAVHADDQRPVGRPAEVEVVHRPLEIGPSGLGARGALVGCGLHASDSRPEVGAARRPAWRCPQPGPAVRPRRTATRWWRGTPRRGAAPPRGRPAGSGRRGGPGTPGRCRRAAPAGDRRGRRSVPSSLLPGVDLHRGLGGGDLQDAPRRRVLEPGGHAAARHRAARRRGRCRRPGAPGGATSAPGRAARRRPGSRTGCPAPVLPSPSGMDAGVDREVGVGGHGEPVVVDRAARRRG